jgi:hypothetical protein
VRPRIKPGDVSAADAERILGALIRSGGVSVE